MINVEQCKRIVRDFLAYTGRGGFVTGTVTSTTPLRIRLSDKIELDADMLYVSDSCTGLTVNGKRLRPRLAVGDGVVLICRPRNLEGHAKYILHDRIQPYTADREVWIDDR